MVLINCTTKGCLQQTEAKLNRDTQEVVCEQCGSPITVTEQMKRTLASVGQVLRSKITPFQQHCSGCKTMKSLYVKGNTAYCERCHTQITVTPAFLQGLKLHLERTKKFKDEGIE